ncbi:helix-turn-helix domain-containing protein [uncultured Microbacterium sp.]|uniref:helix-turn-helix domain-containing protein n=1 Tax=uncultured Microbacterium sp. TaxID=191216 RepID=UPI0028E73746|nr:helix-turn-helix domain-containing protein [uncultured Microbacterium sp.]
MTAPTAINSWSQSDVRQIEHARELFLTRASDDLSALRPIVARSWYRSRAAGVHPDVDRSFLAEGRVDENTIGASEVHLRQLDDVVREMGGYVSLTAPNGALIKPSFILDDGEFPPGYSLLEESSGSNGEGLALEEGRGVWLAPEEHFRQDMRGNWCFASLVRDPFHNRVRAVVGLTLPADRVRGIEPSSTLLMLEGVASRIEHEIERRTSSKERALLREYLTTARRRGNSPVIAVDGKNTLMNSAASATIVDADFSVLFGYAKHVMATGRGAQHEVVLIGPGAAILEIEPVRLPGSTTAAIIVVRASEGRGHSAPKTSVGVPTSETSTIEDALRHSLDGASPAFMRSIKLAGLAVAQRRSVVIVGEAGAGKRRLADAISRLVGSSFAIDCSSTDGPSIREQVVRSVIEAPDALILENADEISRQDAVQIASLFRTANAMRVILTITRSTDATLVLAEACNALEISITPLRTRREDIAEIAISIVAELGDWSLSRALVTTLTNSDWPRNIDHLRSVVSDAVKRARGTEVTEDDLPQGFQKLLTNGRLSRLEEAELSELRMALREAQGNRRLAAEMLEIGRSTLYRRMDYFRGRGFDV